MQITNPIPIQFSSTYTLNLSSNPHTLFVLKIIISNPTIAQTITFYNQNGSVEGQPIVLTNSVEIKFDEPDKDLIDSALNPLISRVVEMLGLDDNEIFDL